MKTATSLILMLSAFAAAPAIAQTVNSESRIVVRTADLDLSSSAGQRALDHRIAIAVVEACGATSPADPAGRNEILRCRDETSATVAANRERLVELASKGKDIVLAAR